MILPELSFTPHFSTKFTKFLPRSFSLIIFGAGTKPKPLFQNFNFDLIKHFFTQALRQMYFDTVQTVWTSKKALVTLFSYIFHIKTKLNIVYKYLKTNIFSRDTNNLPNASNIKYFWTHSYSYWGYLGITKLSNP